MYKPHLLASADGFTSDVSRPLNIPIDGADFGPEYYKIDWTQIFEKIGTAFGTAAKGVLIVGVTVIILATIWENVRMSFPGLA